MSRTRTAERCWELSRGYAFFAYPRKECAINSRTPNGVRGILDTLSGCGCLLWILQAYAKSAYAWLISQHASGVRTAETPNHGLRRYSFAIKSTQP